MDDIITSIIVALISLITGGSIGFYFGKNQKVSQKVNQKAKGGDNATINQVGNINIQK